MAQSADKTYDKRATDYRGSESLAIHSVAIATAVMF